MPPSPPASGRVRPAAVVNAEIRGLWSDPRVGLTAEGRATLEALYAEWVVAARAEVAEAA